MIGKNTIFYYKVPFYRILQEFDFTHLWNQWRKIWKFSFINQEVLEKAELLLEYLTACGEAQLKILSKVF